MIEQILNWTNALYSKVDFRIIFITLLFAAIIVLILDQCRQRKCFYCKKDVKLFQSKVHFTFPTRSEDKDIHYITHRACYTQHQRKCKTL